MPDVVSAPLSAVPPRAIGGAHLITRDTNLRVDSFNAASGVTLTFVIRSIGFDGQPIVDVFQHTPNTDRSIKTETFGLSDGWLLSCQAYASSGSPRRGQCFLRVQLIQGFTGATVSLATILQGYAQDTTALAFPGSAIESSVAGRGVLRAITGSNPAAGAEISETVPTNARWRLQNFMVQFTTSAVAANRRPTLIIDDGATIFFHVNSGTDHAASTTWTYEGAAVGSKWTQFNGSLSWALPPDLWLAGGWRIRTATTAIDAGDDYAAPVYTVEEWIED